MSNYQFLDAYSSVQTAAANTVTGALQPIVQIGSVLSALPVSVTPTANQSVSGTVGASIVGTVPVTQAGAWTQSVVGTVFIAGSVAAIYAGTSNQSVSGTVGASVIGTVPVTFVNSSISGQVGASVIGTVPITQSGKVITSVVGGYAEDSAHTSGDIGLFSLNVRNETMASITSNDGDYSPMATGPAGEGIVANAPLTKWVQGIASTFTGVIQPVIAAQGSSIFTYITGVQVANNSANNVYLTFYGASSSVIGYTVAPANGGSNIVLPNAWKTNANGAFSASVSGTASVFISAEGFISKT